MPAATMQTSPTQQPPGAAAQRWTRASAVAAGDRAYQAAAQAIRAHPDRFDQLWLMPRYRMLVTAAAVAAAVSVQRLGTNPLVALERALAHNHVQQAVKLVDQQAQAAGDPPGLLGLAPVQPDAAADATSTNGDASNGAVSPAYTPPPAEWSQAGDRIWTPGGSGPIWTPDGAAPSTQQAAPPTPDASPAPPTPPAEHAGLPGWVLPVGAGLAILAVLR